MEEDEEEQIHLLQRRQIYYKRLVGDNIFGTQQKVSVSQKGSTWSVMFFVFYFFVAVAVIMDRSDVGTQFAVNTALRQALEETPYTTSPSKETFADIRELDDAIRWMTEAVLPLLCSGQGFQECADTGKFPGCTATSLPFSLLSFNRVLPAQYMAADNARVRLTMRKMKSITGVQKTDFVSGRFTEFVPFVWSDFSLEGVDPETSSHDMQNILNAKYAYDGVPEQLCAANAENEDYKGWGPCSTTGGNETGNANVGDVLRFEWEYCNTGCGYGGQDGYVLDLVLSPTAEQTKVLNALEGIDPERIKDEVTSHQYVYLYGGTDPPGTAPTGQVHGLRGLLDSNVIDASVSFMAWEMWVYNANLQTLSHIRVPLSWNASGYLQSKRILIDTLLLELANPTTDLLEMIYLTLTIYQAFIWGWRFHKRGFRACIRDFYVYLDLFSTIMSLLSMTIWSAFEAEGMQFANKIPSEDAISQRIESFKTYTRISSFATLTIALRIIKYLGNTFSRVQLLQHTLKLATPPFMWYLLYISILFFGFINFGQINFAMQSGDFRTLHASIVSCFTMFMGEVGPIDTVGSNAMKPYFFVLFMMFFFFVSVQMFNSIINYSYNMSREVMEPEFHREKMEAKARALQNQNKPSSLQRFMGLFFKRRNRSRNARGSAENGHGPSLEGVKDNVREKVELHQRIEKEKMKADNALDVILFLIFAASYLLFLHFNLQVSNSFEMRSRIDDTMQSANVETLRVDGNFEPLTYSQVTNMEEADTWLTTALPDAIFSSAGRNYPEEINTYWPKDAESIQRVMPMDNLCFSGWNCLVMRREEKLLLRITVRKIPMSINQCTCSDLSDCDCGESGCTCTVTLSSGEAVVEDPITPFAPSYGYGLIPYRLVNASSSPIAPVNLDVESNHDIEVSGGTGRCEFKDAGFGGYSNAGGYECVLPSDRESFAVMMQGWREAGMLSVETQTAVMEFVTFNGNVNMLTYSNLVMNFQRSGTVKIKLDTIPFSIKSYTSFEEILEFLFLAVYLLLTLFYYTTGVINKFYIEYLKKTSTSRAPFVQIVVQLVYEHFLGDLFNILDVVSIAFSLVSTALFLNFTTQMLSFDSLWTDDDSSTSPTEEFTNFLTTMQQLSFDMKVYTRLSSLNVIVIFVRFLKFFRDNPRMNKLSQTLALAALDITWFIVMLVVVLIGFMTFGYVTFGPQLEEASTQMDALRYCFQMIIGDFDFWRIYEVDSFMAHIFFFLFIVSFNLLFVNIFFAIIDCFFVTTTPPPINWKAKLKPVVGSLPLFNLIQWDDDINMEADGDAEDKPQPPSRTDAAKKARKEIERLHRERGGKVGTGRPVMSLDITEVNAETDEKFAEVIAWSKDEARKFIDKFQRMKDDKATFPSEAEFVNRQRKVLFKQLQEDEAKMKEAERRMKYALQLHEKSAMQDLDTVSRYMLLLEHKIQRKSLKRMRMVKEKEFLKIQAELLQYTEEELEERVRAADFTALEQGHSPAEDIALEDAEAEADVAEQQAAMAGNNPPEIEPDGHLAAEQSETREKQRKEFLGSLEDD